MNRLEISITQPTAHRARADFLRRRLRKAARWLGVTQGSLSIALVRDPEMRRVHKQYLGTPTTTDVISFDLTAQPDPRQVRPKPRQAPPRGAALGSSSTHAVLCDIILCLDEAQRQVKQHRQPLNHELFLYALHGLLHMLGYDDRTPAAHQKMHAKEDEVFEALGLEPMRVGREAKKKTIGRQDAGTRRGKTDGEKIDV